MTFKQFSCIEIVRIWYHQRRFLFANVKNQMQILKAKETCSSNYFQFSILYILF